MWRQIQPATRFAYNSLLNTLIEKNESESGNPPGCIIPSELAAVCVTAFNNDSVKCQNFIYDVVTSEPTDAQSKTLTYSQDLQITDFGNIDAEAFNAALNKTLARRHDRFIPSKLQDMGTSFLTHAAAKQVNPFILASIAMYESTYGTSSVARSHNNIGGLMANSKYIKFPSIDASIATQAQTIRTNFSERKLKTLHELGLSGKYCDISVGEKWFSDISSIARRLYQNYNTLIQDK